MHDINMGVLAVCLGGCVGCRSTLHDGGPSSGWLMMVYRVTTDRRLVGLMVSCMRIDNPGRIDALLADWPDSMEGPGRSAGSTHSWRIKLAIGRDPGGLPDRHSWRMYFWGWTGRYGMDAGGMSVCSGLKYSWRLGRAVGNGPKRIAGPAILLARGSHGLPSSELDSRWRREECSLRPLASCSPSRLPKWRR